MRNQFYFFTIILFSLLVLNPYNVVAQRENSHKLSAEALHIKRSGLQPTSRKGYYKQKRYETDQIKTVTDTLNYPLAGEYSLYVYPGGYVSGNNDYGDLAKANYFESAQPWMLTGVLIDFGWATGGNADIEIGVWDNSKSPDSMIGSQIVGLQEIINDVSNEQTTFINFDEPVIVNGDFYVGVVLPTNPGDTVAVLTNTDGDTTPASAWELWNDNTWVRYDDPDGWDFNVSHAIFPIVQSGNFFIADFEADQQTILVNNSVQFTDQSLGDPEMWEWTFEGGEPANSNLQDPLITYNTEGTFDVTLTITKDQETNTITKENFITVTGEPVANIDTLNFPLPGEFIVYVLTNGGGFVNGNNVYGDLAKANQFAVNEEAKITGVLYDFAYATGGNPNIEMAVWGNNSGAPGAKLGSTNVPLDAIKNDIQNQSLTWVPFNPPITVNQQFYAGFMLPQAAGDTLVVWGNDDGDTNPGTAWDQWNDNTWHPFFESGSWELNIALGIHPVVEYITGINDHPSQFGLTMWPNPANHNITISWDPALASNPMISIFSADGVLKKEINTSDGNAGLKIEIDDLYKGLYFVILQTVKDFETLKFIKQ